MKHLCLVALLGLLTWATTQLSQANEFAIDPEVLADLEDRGRAEDTAGPADEFIECTDRNQSLIEKLNELQNFAALDPNVAFPPELRMRLSQSFHDCAKLTDKVLTETKAYIRKQPKTGECQTKLAELRVEHQTLLSEINKFESEPLTTQESRATAFGLATALQLTIPLAHGRAALNRHMLCELSAISNSLNTDTIDE